jgi:hypothetical protein
VPVIFVAEPNLIFVDADNSVIGDGELGLSCLSNRPFRIIPFVVGKIYNANYQAKRMPLLYNSITG